MKKTKLFGGKEVTVPMPPNVPFDPTGVNNHSPTGVRSDSEIFSQEGTIDMADNKTYNELIAEGKTELEAREILAAQSPKNATTESKKADATAASKKDRKAFWKEVIKVGGAAAIGVGIGIGGTILVQKFGPKIFKHKATPTGSDKKLIGGSSSKSLMLG